MSEIKLNRLIAVIGVIILIFSMVSCRREYTKGPPKLILWHMEGSNEAQFIDEMVKGFEALHPNEVAIQSIHYAEGDLHQQFLTAAVAGSGPDMVYAPGDKAGILAVGKFIYPVETIFDVNDYVNVALEASKENDHYWGIPVSTGNHLMLMYNKKIVKKVPKTTDELLEYCKVLKEELPDVVCFATNIGEPYFFMPWLASFGGWPIDGIKPTLNTEPMKRALEFFKKLKNVDKIMPTECEYNCMDGLFKDGKAAFIMNGDWAIESYKKMMGNNFGIAVLPTNSETGIPMRPMVGGKYLMINSNTAGQRLDWAVEFVKYYTNYKNQMLQFEKMGRLPGLKKAFEDAEKKAPVFIRPAFEELKLGAPAPMAVEMRAIWDTMLSQLGPYFGDRKDLETALTIMQTNADRKIKEMRVR